MPKGVLIVYPEGRLWHSPVVLNLANCLAQRGIHVIIACFEPADASARPSLHRNVQLHCPLKIANAGKFARIRLSADVWKLARGGWQCLEKLCGPEKICLAVDEFGAIGALLANARPVFYISLELPSRAANFSAALFTDLHSRLYRHACAVAIQDSDRLAELNSVLKARSPKNVFYLPSAARPEKLAVSGENYLRQKLGIGANFRYILLHAGSTGELFLPRPYLKAFAQLNDCAVVVHGPGALSISGEFPDAKNFFFSEELLPYDQIDRLFSSCDVGLNFYDPINPNFALMGRSSGKMSFYLKHGKPVIANNLPSLSSFISNHQCGLVVDEPSVVADAVRQILDNYAFYSTNAERCFLEALSFDKFAEPILEWIDNAANWSGSQVAAL